MDNRADRGLEKEALEILKEIKEKTLGRVDEVEKKIDNVEKALAEIKSKVKLAPEGSKEKKENFLKWFIGVVNKAHTEGTDNQGGYLVPEEHRYDIIRVIEQAGVIRPRATVIPVNTDTINLKTLASGVSVSWTDEAASISEQSATFGNVAVSVKKMAAIAKFSVELLEDANVDIAKFLITLFGEAIAREEDRVALKGNTGGTDPFDGLLYAANVAELSLASGNTSFSDVTADDLLDLAMKVKTTERSRGVYVMNPEVRNVIKKLKDSNGNYIYQNPGANAPATIWGYPVVEADQMPSLSDDAADTAFIAFGNLKHIYITDRKKMTVATSTEAAFTTDEVVVKVTQREGIAVAPVSNVLARLKTAAS